MLATNIDGFNATSYFLLYRLWQYRHANGFSWVSRSLLARVLYASRHSDDQRGITTTRAPTSSSMSGTVLTALETFRADFADVFSFSLNSHAVVVVQGHHLRPFENQNKYENLEFV